MSIHYRLHFKRGLPVRNVKTVLAAVSHVVLLPTFVFYGLTSAWSLSNSAGPIQALWYGCSSALLFGAAGLMIYRLIGHTLSRRGGASGTLPLAGAPCPVPIRPTPHLVRSAAEALPREGRKELKAYRGTEIGK